MRLEPSKLLATAKKLARAGGGERRPRQSDLRRSISTTYYALFHQVCGDYANFLLGRQQNAFNQEAWQRAYRSVVHGNIRDRAEKADLAAFSEGVREFSAKLVEMQQKRHLADYDPFVEFKREEVLAEIEQVELAIANYKSVSVSERRAYVAVLMGFKKGLP